MQIYSEQGEYYNFKPPKIMAEIKTPKRKNVYTMINDFKKN